VVYAQHPDTFTVAEESTAWPGVSRPTDKGGLGFGFKWDMGWMHDTLRYLGEGMMARPHHHNEITFSMVYHGSENYVLPLSHDEVVHGSAASMAACPAIPGSGWRTCACSMPGSSPTGQEAALHGRRVRTRKGMELRHGAGLGSAQSA